MKLLYIDCCIRGECSRTRKIAEAFLSEMHCETETLVLDRMQLLPLDSASLARREAFVAAGDYSDGMFGLSKQFAQAEMIVVAAPLWDMGVPAKLKTYFEHVSVSGLAFREDEAGLSGCCKAEHLVYLTTRGMELPDGHPMEQGTSYVKAISRFFGIREFHAVSAWGMDMVPSDEADRRLNAAMEAARELALSLRG